MTYESPCDQCDSPATILVVTEIYAPIGSYVKAESPHWEYWEYYCREHADEKYNDAIDADVIPEWPAEVAQ